MPHLVDCVGGVDGLPLHRGKLTIDGQQIEEYSSIRSALTFPLSYPPTLMHTRAFIPFGASRGFCNGASCTAFASVGSPQVKAASCGRGKLIGVCWYWWQHSNGTRRRAVGQKDHCRRRGDIVVERGGAFDDTVLLWCRYSAAQCT